ncbi:hypothetical protein IFO70_35220 [Phormidium tenue FACHB-886]|nr:hypothetical protein [Phormidium tenue FACHB-886]
MTNFFFAPNSYDIKSLASLHRDWRGILNEEVKNRVAIEHQYFDFHVSFLLKSLQTRSRDGTCSSFGLSARVGAVRSAIFICGSIAEAVLREYAERCNWKAFQKLKEQEKTLGRLVSVWKQCKPSAIQPIRQELELLIDKRNGIHLYKEVLSHNGTSFRWQEILEQEKHFLNAGCKVLQYLQASEFFMQ